VEKLSDAILIVTAGIVGLSVVLLWAVG